MEGRGREEISEGGEEIEHIMRKGGLHGVIEEERLKANT